MASRRAVWGSFESLMSCWMVVRRRRRIEDSSTFSEHYVYVQQTYSEHAFSCDLAFPGQKETD
jgi:hypothetical protein